MLRGKTAPYCHGLSDVMPQETQHQHLSLILTYSTNLVNVFHLESALSNLK